MNARTKKWIEFSKEHEEEGKTPIPQMTPAQIWHAGFDAGWYARLEREQELTEQLPKSDQA